MLQVACDVRDLSFGHEGRDCKGLLVLLGKVVVHPAEEETHEVCLLPHDGTVITIGQFVQTAVHPSGKPPHVIGCVAFEWADGRVWFVIGIGLRWSEAPQFGKQALLTRLSRSESGTGPHVNDQVIQFGSGQVQGDTFEFFGTTDLWHDWNRPHRNIDGTDPGKMRGTRMAAHMPRELVGRILASFWPQCRERGAASAMLLRCPMTICCPLMTLRCTAHLATC